MSIIVLFPFIQHLSLISTHCLRLEVPVFISSTMSEPSKITLLILIYDEAVRLVSLHHYSNYLSLYTHYNKRVLSLC